MPKEDTQFKPGNSGGPGRRMGSRNKLSEYLLQSFAKDFKKDGPAAIVRLRESSPGEYLRIAASLVPKELLLEVSQDEQISWVINAGPVLSSKEWFEQAKLEAGKADE